MGDEEDARARGPQRRRSFGDAGPVSIGLDDGGATPRRRAARKVAPVVGQRAEVDPQAPRRAHRSHDVHHSRTFSITAVVGVSNPGCASTSRRAKPQRSNSRSFSGSSSRVLSVMRLAPRRLASVSQAAISERANPRPRARGATDTRATWSASSLRLHSAAAMSAPPSKTPNPPPAAILAAIDGPVSRRADDGGVVCRLWAAKAVRMTSAASSASAFVNGRRTSSGRRFGVLGDWIANLHARMYKTVARLEGKGGKFPQRLRASWTKFNPCFRSASRPRLVFAALAGEDRSGAVHRANTSHEADDSMTMSIDPQGGVEGRRGRGAGGARLLARLPRLPTTSVETHGLSSFGDLALPPDFPHFAYVNPDAPTGGLLSLQITGTSGNQNFDTFDTLNIYSWKGNGAAGMSATFDTLMTANGDEPDSVYGLLAQSVRVSADKLDYRFRLRPEARFFDGSKVTAADVAFSLNVLKEKGHPIYAQLLKEVESANAEGDDVVHVRFVQGRSRDAHLIVVGMPVFSAAWWKGRDFTAATLDPPLGSGAYKVKTFEQGRFIEYARDPNYWGAKLPVNLGPEQLRSPALRILSRAAGRLRGVQGRSDQLSRGVHLALLGDVLRLPRRQGRPGEEGDPA